VITGLRNILTRPRDCKRNFRVSDTFALVVEVSRTEFERMVGDALDEIPDALATEMQNVAVMVED